MDGANGSSSSPAPFLLKTYEMVDDHLTNGVVSWSRTGHSFVVWNPPEFAGDMLPKYFKHNNFSSFIRQLNTYGFRKVDPEQWEFANEEFIRGQRHLLNNIRRRKPIHSHSGNVNAVTDSEREEYEKEIEKLKQERVSLETEVESYRQKNRGYEDELRSLGQTLQGIDQRQRQLVDCLARLLQSPGYGSGLMDQSESPSKKRRLLALRYLRDEEAKLIKEDPSHSSPLPVLDLKQVEKLDSSLTFWETFLRGIDQIPPENTPSSPMESDINVPPCTPPQECCTETLAYVTSSIRIDPESRPNKPSGVDMNISPDARSAEGSTGTIQAVAANDVFWQQFLTEAPASSMVQAEQREAYERTTNPSRFADEHKPWWTVDGLATQHTGHLSQAERI